MRLKICTICGKTYEVRGKRFSTAKFCSATCYGRSRRNQVERICRNCRKTFIFKPSQYHAYPNAGKYCSRKCGYEYRVAKNALKPVKDKYGRSGRKADVEWKQAVRERYNYTCQRCGIYNLHIDCHHINTRARRPDLKHDVNNGVTLCRRCHSWVHHHPAEASVLGLLGGESYEKARLMERYNKVAQTNKNRVYGIRA